MSEHLEADIKASNIVNLSVKIFVLKSLFDGYDLKYLKTVWIPTQRNIEALQVFYYRHLSSSCNLHRFFLQKISLLVHEKYIWQVCGYL